MSDDHDPFAWAAYAESDFQAAKRMLRGKNKFPNIGCYHAQQSAEKYLKALMIANGMDFPKIHNLRRLQDMLESTGVVVPVDPDMLDVLNVGAIQARYPGDPLSLEEAKEAIKIAKDVRKFVRRRIGASK
jgi:HEPN domain-containing protein